MFWDTVGPFENRVQGSVKTFVKKENPSILKGYFGFFQK